MWPISAVFIFIFLHIGITYFFLSILCIFVGLLSILLVSILLIFSKDRINIIQEDFPLANCCFIAPSLMTCAFLFVLKDTDNWLNISFCLLYTINLVFSLFWLVASQFFTLRLYIAWYAGVLIFIYPLSLWYILRFY